jgi:hypothetical protein
MSRWLLKFGGGLACSTLHVWRGQAEALVACPQGIDERPHVFMAPIAMEVFLCFDDARHRPAQHHLSAAPRLHIAVHLPKTTDEVLDRVGRRERAPQRVADRQVRMVNVSSSPSRRLAAALG